MDGLIASRAGMPVQPSQADNRHDAEVWFTVPTALVLNPRSDAVFVAFAEAALTDGVTTPDAFQDRLRERYPRAVVRQRELASEQFTIWYCYRDGRWVQP